MKLTSFAKKYKRHEVLISDMVSDKRILILKGGNGSGKSTLLKAIHKMITYKGTIVYEGTISFMNEVIHFPTNFKVIELINAFNCIDKTSAENMNTLIDQFDLSNKLEEYIFSLSKGMRMKLQLLCTFIVDKDIYVLDEPFSGLDQASVIKLMNFIQKSSKRFIIATHIDVSFQKDCDVILV